MRWNNIGIIGGRVLLTALEVNKTLCELQITGNNIPVDIVTAIQTMIANNEERRQLSSEYQTRAQMMSREMHQLEKSSKMHLSELMNRVDVQQDQLAETTRCSSLRISQLQCALDERKSTVDSLASKLQMLEASLAMSEQKSHDLSNQLEKKDADIVAIAAQHRNDVEMQREEKIKLEEDLLSRLARETEKCVKLQNRQEDMERKFKQHQEQIFELKEELAQTHAEMKLKTVNLEEKLQHEKSKWKQTLQEAEELRQREVSCADAIS